MTRLRVLTLPPDFGDPQLNYRAAILNTFLLAAIVGITLLILFQIWSVNFTSQLPFATAALAVVIVAQLVLRRQYLQTASWIFVLGIWSAITAAGFSSAGIYTPGVVAYILGIIVVAMLLDERATIILAAMSTASMFLMALLGTHGYFTEVQRTIFSPFNVWALYTLCIYLTAVFMWVYLRLLHTSWNAMYTAQQTSEQQRLELLLANEKAQVMTDFLRELNHDLKTPLSVINTNLYFLERVEDPAARRERIHRIEEQTRLVHQYFEDILMFSKTDYDPQVTLVTIDLNTLVDSVESHLRSEVEKKGQTLTVELADKPLRINASATELYRAVANLAENAVHYTPPGGKITLRTHYCDTHALIEVSDSGIGIDEADQPFIFDRYYRGKAARDSGAAGTGLGLAIVKKIITMHRGTIEVSSQRDCGSTFCIRLPLLRL